MQMIRKPSDTITDIMNANGALHHLEKEYGNKKKGEIYTKRKSYLVNKIFNLKIFIKGCCIGKLSTKVVNTWVLNVTKTFDDLDAPMKIIIHMDAALSKKEIIKLIEYNTDSTVKSIILKQSLYLGQIKYF